MGSSARVGVRRAEKERAGKGLIAAAGGRSDSEGRWPWLRRRGQEGPAMGGLDKELGGMALKG